MNKNVPSKDDSTAIPFLTAGSLPSPRVDHTEALVVDTTVDSSTTDVDDSFVFDDSPSALTGGLEKSLLLVLNVFLNQ